MELKIKVPSEDGRPVAQIIEHYTLEKELAAQLLNSHKEERKHLYTSLYNQLFQKIKHHPQISRKMDASASQLEVQRKMNLIDRYLHSDTVFLEVGPGDCKLSFQVAQQVKQVFAVDVSQEITRNTEVPANFELIISDGCNIPIKENSVSVAYSNQLMEHLHPEDAYEQLQGLFRCLKTEGIYICITPNRLAGPHDVSKYFDSVSTGFHLKEYTNQDLYSLFAQIGFSNITTYAGGKGVYFECPRLLTLLCEAILSRIPLKFRYQVGNWLPIRAILGVILVAQK
jgi:ubiquinone/menaquinone biosynthesis C-methylase UbiE